MDLVSLEELHPKEGEPVILVAHREAVLPPNHVDQIFRSLYPVTVSIIRIGTSNSKGTVEPISIYYEVADQRMITVIGKTPDTFKEPLANGELLELFDSAYFAGYCQLMAQAMAHDSRWNEKSLEEDMERRLGALCKQDAYNLEMHRDIVPALLPPEL